MGWSTSEDSISYKNVLAKTRKEKGKESELLVGNDISNIEAVRFNLKTPFDRNVVTQFETQETLLDYGFAHLGLNDESSIDFPIVMTEPLANPNACRFGHWSKFTRLREVTQFDCAVLEVTERLMSMRGL